MWNVRSVLRQLTGRWKTSVNGNCGAQTSKEGRTELEDEYKLWTSNLWTSDVWTSKIAQNIGENSEFFFSTTGKSKNGKNSGHQSSDSERHEWHASDVQSNRSWLEVIGWGAAFGLGLNILQLRQEEHLRKRAAAHNDGDRPCRFNPRWFTNIALSMPYITGQPGLIRSVLPTERLGGSHDSFSLDNSSSSYPSESSEVGASPSEFSEYQRPSYTSETAAMMALMRKQLASVAADYAAGLQKLLAPPQQSENTTSNRFRKAQEEFNMGLFHELGVGVSRDSDEAFRHYVAAAFMEHPVAVENLVSFDKYAATAFPESDVMPERPASMHRCASSPVLSADSEIAVGKSKAEWKPATKRKFWTSSDEDSRSSSGLSRSSSFPDLPRLISCV